MAQPLIGNETDTYKLRESDVYDTYVKDFRLPEHHVTQFQRKGIPLEYATSCAYDILGIEHEHNPFDENYSTFCEDGTKPNHVDLWNDDLLTECKNLAVTRVSDGWVEDELLQRGDNTLGSYLKQKIAVFGVNPLNPTQHNYVEDCAWIILEVGYQVTLTNLTKTIIVLVSKLYPYVTKPVTRNTATYKHTTSNTTNTTNKLPNILVLCNMGRHVKPDDFEYVTMNRNTKDAWRG